MASKKIKTFSGGMKQRLGIAQALLNNPKILVLDEPTAGLDSKERDRLRNILSDFASDKIVLLSTHIVSDERPSPEAVPCDASLEGLYLSFFPTEDGGK